MSQHTPSEQSSSASAHNEAIRQAFTRQATSFSGATYTHQLAWMIDELDPQPGDTVLDVASGTGHIGRAVAARARYVVAMDLTPEMLHHGKAEADATGIRNILFELGDAAHLPYLDASFDLITTRFAIHHFENPQIQLAEMIRVCRPGGRIGIVDLLTVPDTAVAQEHNRLERLRDHTHVEALSLAGLANLLEQSGLQVVRHSTRDIELAFDPWIASAQTSQEPAEQIRAALQAELNGGPSTGMRPFMRDSKLWFTHVWVVIIALKPPNVSA